MKKLLVIAFMIAGTATFAQVNGGSGNNNMVPDKTKMVEVRSQKMKTDLGLNDDQTAQIKTLFAKQLQDREAEMTEVRALRANGQQLTDAQKSDIKAKMDADKAAMDAQLKQILTPEQYAKWQSRMTALNAPKAATAG